MNHRSHRAQPDVAEPTHSAPGVVEVGGDIRLGQFLKFAGLAESGARATELIHDGAVLVDGAVETRRGRQLHGGESVTVVLGDVQQVVKVG